MNDQTKQILRRSRILEGLNDDQIERVLALGKEQRVSLGDAIVEEGEEGTAVFLLLQGRINIERRHLFQGGKPQILATLEPGETFSEMSLVDRQARSATCRAIEPVVVLRIENELLETFIAQTPDIGLHLMRNLAAQLAMRLRNLDAKMQQAMIDIFYY